MRKLAGQFSDLSDLWPEKNETSIQRAEGSLFEEGIAARLMAELQGGLPIEEITDRLSRVETEIELRRKILAETPLSPSLREEVQVRLDWVIQMKRWWSLQKRLYNQDNLLKECSGKMQEITDTDYKQRFQEWLDSLAQREEIDTLHNKIGDLMVEKRMALKYAETIQKDQGTIQNIKKILLQVEGIQESSSGDIQMTKDVLKKVDAVLQETLDKKQVRYYENALEQARSEANEARRETTALRNQVADNHKTLAGEKEKFEQAIKIMQYALEEATIGKKELEEGLAQLQESYAALKKRLEKHTN